MLLSRLILSGLLFFNVNVFSSQGMMDALESRYKSEHGSDSGSSDSSDSTSDSMMSDPPDIATPSSSSGASSMPSMDDPLSESSTGSAATSSATPMIPATPELAEKSSSTMVPAKPDPAGESSSSPSMTLAGSEGNLGSSAALSKRTKTSLEVDDVQISDPMGLDTINVDSGGNWLEKRIWFKKAEGTFDEIRIEEKKAADIRLEFVNQVNSIGKKLDDFFESLSFDKGQLDQFLKDVLDEISDSSFNRGGDLSDKERNWKLQIKGEQKQIEQLSDDMKKVDEFDAQIDKTMTQVFKLIDECRDFETQAWNNYKAIGAELDDKKAKTLYYEIENSYENVQQNIKHLESSLLPYLKNQLIQPANQAMSSVISAIQTLKGKGLNIEKLINGEIKNDQQLEKEREEEREKEVEQDWEKKQDEEQAKKAAEKKARIAEKKKEEENKWYNRFLSEFGSLIKPTICCIIIKIESVGEFFSNISPEYLQQIYSFFGNIGCYIFGLLKAVTYFLGSMICSIKEFLCQFFG